MYTYTTYPMMANGGSPPIDGPPPGKGNPWDYLFSKKNQDLYFKPLNELTPNQRHTRFLSEINALKIQKLGYPSPISSIDGTHHLLPKLDLNFNIPANASPFLTNGKFDIEKWNAHRKPLPNRIHPGINSFNVDSRITKNVDAAQNIMRKQDFLKQVNTLINQPKLSKIDKIKNFLSKAGRVTGKVLNKLDPFPWMIAPIMAPDMYQYQTPQAMKQGGEGPSVMRNYL